jgi:hypothetical protein
MVGVITDASALDVLDQPRSQEMDTTTLLIIVLIILLLGGGWYGRGRWY